MMRRWLTLADMVVLLAAGILIAWLYITLWIPDTPGLEVEIWSRGERIETVPLAENHTFEVAGPLGFSHIEIKDGQVRFMESPCSNKLCILSGWLKHPGETTACLPNQVSVRIIGRDRRYDAINF